MDETRPQGPITFEAFILGLATTTLIHLGYSPDPDTGVEAVDLPAARETLDLLDLLRRKTQGNLTGDEDQLFASLLTDLRMKYVEKSQHRAS